MLSNSGESTRGPVTLWCGSYTGASGAGEGISLLEADDSGRLRRLGLAARADSPSFLAAHPALRVVYAVDEGPARTVQAYRRTSFARLEPLGQPWQTGASPCHVAVDPEGRYLVVACWGDGAVLLGDLGRDGTILSLRDAPRAVDPYEDDDRTSRAHATLILPDGRLLTTDLGYDLLRVWRYEPGSGLIADHDVPLGRGSGPRHLARHPSGHVYVVTEHSVEILVLRPDSSERFALVGRGPATAGGAREGDAPAEISVDEAGSRVYVTVRGSNRIVTLAVRDGGGRLEPLADTECGGDWPRHHLQHGSWIHVANQRSSTVTTFRLDPDTGVPTELVGTVAAGSPSCLVPYLAE